MKKIYLIMVIILFTIPVEKTYSKYIYGANKKEYITYVRSGLKYLKSKNYNKALKYLSYAADFFPTRHGKITKGNIYYLIGYCNYKLDKYENALNWYKKSLDFNPMSLATYREIIRTLKEMNNYKLARKTAYQIERYKLNNRKVILHVANLFILAKEYNRAITYYKHLLIKNNSDLYALRQLANCYIELEKYKKAISLLKRILIIWKYDTNTITLLGVAYFKMKMYAKSESIFIKLIQRNRKNFIAYYNIACIYSMRKKYDKAIRLLERAIQLGYTNFKAIKNDNDLSGLKNTVEFKNLIIKYKEKQNKKNNEKAKQKPSNSSSALE